MEGSAVALYVFVLKPGDSVMKFSNVIVFVRVGNLKAAAIAICVVFLFYYFVNYVFLLFLFLLSIGLMRVWTVLRFQNFNDI